MYWPPNARGVGSMSSGPPVKSELPPVGVRQRNRLTASSPTSGLDIHFRQNQLLGTHIATGYPIEITLNAKEMQLATVKGPYINRCWEYMCESLESRGEAGRDLIEGNIEIDYIVIEGEVNVFH